MTTLTNFKASNDGLYADTDDGFYQINDIIALFHPRICDGFDTRPLYDTWVEVSEKKAVKLWLKGIMVKVELGYLDRYEEDEPEQVIKYLKKGRANKSGPYRMVCLVSHTEPSKIRLIPHQQLGEKVLTKIANNIEGYQGIGHAFAEGTENPLTV